MTGLADATVEQVATLAALTDLLVGVEQTISSLQAARDGVLALGSRLALELAGTGEDAGHPDAADLSLRVVVAELGAALRVSDRTVQRRMADAVWVVDRFPAVWEAQGAGRISAAHTRVICDAGEHLEDAADRDAYAMQVLVFAETESPNRVARHARRVAERFQPRSLDDRHQDAREQRRVWVTDTADGMSTLGLLGPAALVHGVFDRLTAMAHAVQRQESGQEISSDGRSVQEGSGESGASAFGPAADPPALIPTEEPRDPRTLSQTRADLALDLLLTGAPTGHDSPDGLLATIVGTVSITVPVTTLIGTDTSPGLAPAELDGTTPIDPATARTLAGAASGWDRILTHPITGTVLAVDRYRPTADMKRHLTARDQRCRFPGCGHRARDCDIDHHHDHAHGGPTTHTNLGHLCRRHHTLKHHTPWHVHPLGDGTYSWTSPTGRTYTDKPPPPTTVTFTEHDTERDTGGRPPPF